MQSTDTTLITVKVNLADGTSYETSVNARCTDDEIRAYFVGQGFNFGTDGDKIICCTSVEISR